VNCPAAAIGLEEQQEDGAGRQVSRGYLVRELGVGY
jgi:hypothetical protein